MYICILTFFSESLEVSATTEYDWSQTTETTMNEQTTIELQATAPAGLFFFKQKSNVFILTQRTDSAGRAGCGSLRRQRVQN